MTVAAVFSAVQMSFLLSSQPVMTKDCLKLYH